MAALTQEAHEVFSDALRLQVGNGIVTWSPGGRKMRVPAQFSSSSRRTTTSGASPRRNEVFNSTTTTARSINNNNNNSNNHHFYDSLDEAQSSLYDNNNTNNNNSGFETHAMLLDSSFLSKGKFGEDEMNNTNTGGFQSRMSPVKSVKSAASNNSTARKSDKYNINKAANREKMLKLQKLWVQAAEEVFARGEDEVEIEGKQNKTIPLAKEEATVVSALARRFFEEACKQRSKIISGYYERPPPPSASPGMMLAAIRPRTAPVAPSLQVGAEVGMFATHSHQSGKHPVPPGATPPKRAVTAGSAGVSQSPRFQRLVNNANATTNTNNNSNNSSPFASFAFPPPKQTNGNNVIFAPIPVRAGAADATSSSPILLNTTALEEKRDDQQEEKGDEEAAALAQGGDDREILSSPPLMKTTTSPPLPPGAAASGGPPSSSPPLMTSEALNGVSPRPSPVPAYPLTPGAASGVSGGPSPPPGFRPWTTGGLSSVGDYYQDLQLQQQYFEAEMMHFQSPGYTTHPFGYRKLLESTTAHDSASYTGIGLSSFSPRPSSSSTTTMYDFLKQCANHSWIEASGTELLVTIRFGSAVEPNRQNRTRVQWYEMIRPHDGGVAIELHYTGVATLAADGSSVNVHLTEKRLNGEVRQLCNVSKDLPCKKDRRFRYIKIRDVWLQLFTLRGNKIDP